MEWQSFRQPGSFRFLKTVVCGISFPFHRNFTEINVRFYVRREERNEIKRGVVFLSEIVPRWAIAAIARNVYNEKYSAFPMSHRVEPREDSGLFIEYGWKSPNGWNRLSLHTEGTPAHPQPGSEEQFITEHYWGYAAQLRGGTVEYRVAHPSWRVWNGANAKFEGNTTQLYGEEMATILQNKPSSAFLAEGSEITVSKGKKL